METRKKIDYKYFCKKAIDIIKRINESSKEIAKFELSEPVRDEINEIIELSNKANNTELKEPYKGIFSDLMEYICQINDDLHEIEMVISELINKVNKLPGEARKAWYYATGIKEIPKEYERLSEDLIEKIHGMMGLIAEIEDEIEGYFSLEKEDYVDYKDEIEKD